MLMKRIEEYDHIYIACGYTDMRKGIDGLVECIRVMKDKKIVVVLKGGMQAEEYI